MSLTEGDVHWLRTIDSFKKSEQDWLSCSKKHLITPDLCHRIDLLYQVLRRFLDSVTYTSENRCKFYKQLLGLSFLMTKAQLEMGISSDDISI